MATRGKRPKKSQVPPAPQGDRAGDANRDSIQALYLVREVLVSLHFYMESPDAPEISWEHPWVELRIPIEWDWDTNGPAEESPGEDIQTGVVIGGAERVAEHQVRYDRRAVLHGFTGGLAFAWRRGKETKRYRFLPDREGLPSEGARFVQGLASKNDRTLCLGELKQPFSIGEIDWDEAEPVYALSRNRRAAGQELGELLSFEGDIDGEPLRVGPIVKIHPLVVDEDERAVYYPVEAGLLCFVFPEDARQRRPWVPESSAATTTWELIFERIDNLVGDVLRAPGILPRLTSIMSPVPVPRHAMPLAESLGLTEGLGRMFAGYAKIPDLDLLSEAALDEAERTFWPLLAEHLNAMEVTWTKTALGDQTTITINQIQVDEARRRWRDFTTSLNATNGGPGIDVQQPDFVRKNRMASSRKVVIETDIVLWPDASLTDREGKSVPPVRYRKETSPGYVDLLDRQGPRPFFAQGWLWISRGKEREGFRIGGLPTLLFPEGRAALERIMLTERASYDVELNRIIQAPTLFHDDDVRTIRGLEAARQRVMRDIAKLSVYGHAHDLIFCLFESFYRQRDAWISERVTLPNAKQVDTRPWRILCLDPNSLRLRLDPKKQWGKNWRGQLFDKLEALTTFERQTRTSEGRRMDVGDRLLTRVVDGRQGISDGAAPDGDPGMGLTRILKDAGGFPIDAFFVEISLEFMGRLVTWAVDENGVAHWGIDAAKAAERAHLAELPDDARGARETARGIRQKAKEQPYFDHSPRLQTLMNLEDWPDSMKLLAWTISREVTPNYERRRGANGSLRRAPKKNHLGGKEKLETIDGQDYVACNGNRGHGYRIETWIEKAGYRRLAQKRPKRLQLWVESVRKLHDVIGLQARFSKRPGDTTQVLGILEQYNRTPELGYDAVVQFFLPQDLERQVRDRLAEAGIDAIDENEALGTILTPSQSSGLSPADIRAARTEAGWTQAELAAKIGVSRPMITYWETGQKPVPEDRMDLLREILNR